MTLHYKAALAAVERGEIIMQTNPNPAKPDDRVKYGTVGGGAHRQRRRVPAADGRGQAGALPRRPVRGQPDLSGGAMIPSPHLGHSARIGRPTVSAPCDVHGHSLSRAVVQLAAGIALAAAFPAFAQDARSLSGTTVTLQPTTRPGAVAQIDYDNRAVNGPDDEIEFSLSCCALTVVVLFDWNADLIGSDAITVTPPEGVTCLPVSCVLTLPEGTAGTMWLFEVTGVGM